VTVARTASLCRRSLDGGYGGNGVHKRRNGVNGDETEKTDAPFLRLWLAPQSHALCSAMSPTIGSLKRSP
jgi:hypothetical protein